MQCFLAIVEYNYLIMNECGYILTMERNRISVTVQPQACPMACISAKGRQCHAVLPYADKGEDWHVISDRL